MSPRTLLRTLVILLVTMIFATIAAATPIDKNTRTDRLSATPTMTQAADSVRTVYIDDTNRIGTNYTFEIQNEDTAALTPASNAFRAKKILVASIPNFTTPLRRAPLKRKGRIQG